MSETNGQPRARLGLFEAVGIELEYMIVDRTTMDVRPIADRLLAEGVRDARLTVTDVEREAPETSSQDSIQGKPTPFPLPLGGGSRGAAEISDCSGVPSEIAISAVDGKATRHSISWSNELTAHVIELKTSGPVRLDDGGGRSLWRELAEDFQTHVRAINRMLEPHNAMLMGTAMHPWMDPNREKVLWPHGRREIYEAFDRVFDCRGHGWANLQSMHINLPFADDEEFGRLHAAIRMILPLLPALAASSPIMDGRVTGVMDNRLAVYKTNARRVPSVAGKVIPEPVFTRGDYEREIFQRIFRDIAPHEVKAGVEPGTLQHEWLNSRGAIARFDRGAIEIRVLDVQEHPGADLAIADLIVRTLRALTSGAFAPFAEQAALDTDMLARVLDRCIEDADGAVIGDEAYCRAWGVKAGLGAQEVWGVIAERVGVTGDEFARGCLARRMRSRMGASEDAGRERLVALTRELVKCLHEGRELGD